MTWKELRQRYLAGWWPAQGETVLVDPARVQVTRYRYRGDAFPRHGPGRSGCNRRSHSPAAWTRGSRRAQARGLSQEAAARQLGVSVKTVSRWVGGETEPRLHDLRRIHQVFGEAPSLSDHLEPLARRVAFARMGTLRAARERTGACGSPWWVALEEADARPVPRPLASRRAPKDLLDRRACLASARARPAQVGLDGSCFEHREGAVSMRRTCALRLRSWPSWR
jgi:transcriptional regulator with XRE-family HTH domain